MRIFTVVLLSSLFFLSHAQNAAKYNLNLEDYDPKNELPKEWFQWGSYTLETDSIKSFKGKYSGKIVANDSGNFGSIAYRIPANYTGDSIELRGYMKTLKVEDGFAGLLLRIDAASGTKSLVFNNMQDQNINGSNDWKEYKIKLPYPKGGKTIYVAGLLVGKGTAWFDDFVVRIDGEDLQIKEETENPDYPANLDTAFLNGSNIEIGKLNKSKLQQIATLGKIWGFLKYYHPEIGNGRYNWDFELFRILPNIQKTKSDEEFNQVILSWIESLGTIDTCDLCEAAPSTAVYKPDLSWLHSEILEESLRSKLWHIYNNRYQGSHFYFEIGSSGNATFTNEKGYENLQYPDDGYRLLALLRYWNLIQYFFPYKHLIGQDWDEVLLEYIPKFVAAENELNYELILAKLIAEINDTHAQLLYGTNKLESWKGKYESPYHLDFVENKLVVVDFYNTEIIQKDDLQIGDIITHVNKIPVANLTDSLKGYYSASNARAKNSIIARNLLRSNTSKITVDYIRGNTSNEKTVDLYPEEKINKYEWQRGHGKPSIQMLDNDIVYVTLQTIYKADIEKIISDFHNSKGIIIDIRNYPNTFVPFALGSFFVDKPTPFAKFSKPNPKNPGEFNFTGPVIIHPLEKTYRGKLIVLINEKSISQSEYTSMAFRAGLNTTIIGNTTAGADGDISRMVLPGGITTIISGLGVYYPDGTETQRVGIVPDIEVWPTIKGIREGRDELLEKAIEVILER